MNTLKTCVKPTFRCQESRDVLELSFPLNDGIYIDVLSCGNRTGVDLSKKQVKRLIRALQEQIA